MQAVARDLFPSNPTHQQYVIQYAITCVQPAIQYFEDRYSSDTTFPINIFKATRLFSPSKVNKIQPVVADVNMLSVILFVSGEISQLKEELPVHVAKSTGVDPSFNILDWLRGNSPELPHWSSLAQRVILIQPSSAAAERVFLILNIH